MDATSSAHMSGCPTALPTIPEKRTSTSATTSVAVTTSSANPIGASILDQAAESRIGLPSSKARAMLVVIIPAPLLHRLYWHVPTDCRF